MIPLNQHRAAFGRHETFPLRFGWLTKGFAAWCDNSEIFDQDDSTVVLGVGKNMVNAIKYWMTAAQIVAAHGASVSETELGRAMFAKDGWDRYVEDDSTLWLLHWLIASNAADATATYWFFNHFHKPEFAAPEVAKALEEFCREKISTRFSASTLKHDVALILRMYQRSEVARGVPLEDTLDSPLSLLGLVQAPSTGRVHQSRPSPRPRLPIAAFGYAVLDLLAAMGQSALPVEKISRATAGYAAPGAVFRLTDDGTITKLEELVRWMPETFELRETAGIHQIYLLRQMKPLELLGHHYSQYGSLKEAA